MSKFINSVDQLGDDAVVDSIIEGTIEELRDDTITVLGKGCLAYLFDSLKRVDCPLATAIETGSLSYDYILEFVRTSAKTIGQSAFQMAQKMTILILCGDSVCTLENINAFSNCHHYYGTVNATYNKEGLKDGYIYVPRALVEQYKVATNWSTFADQFRALEDYTVDGTIMGELDESKI